jgi:hypothetical protein
VLELRLLSRFSETVSTIVIKLTYITRISFTKLCLFFHRVSFIMNTLLTLLREALYATRMKLFAEASEIFTQALFFSSSSAKRRLRNAYFRGPKIWKSEGDKSEL